MLINLGEAKALIENPQYTVSVFTLVSLNRVEKEISEGCCTSGIWSNFVILHLVKESVKSHCEGQPWSLKTIWFNYFICRSTVSQIHGSLSQIHQFGTRKWLRYRTKNWSSWNCHNYHCILNNDRYRHHKMWHNCSNFQYKKSFAANIHAYHQDTWIVPNIIDYLYIHLHTMIILVVLIWFDELVCSHCKLHWLL